MKKTIIAVAIIVIIILAYTFITQFIPEKMTSDVPENHFFAVTTGFRCWQGVAADANRIYVTTDRNNHFELENTISVYDHKGQLIDEKVDAYSGTDSIGNFMSFGDCTIIDKRLFATVYNYNSNTGNPFESRIVEFDLDSLEMLNEHDIGDGVAECIVRNTKGYWVVYHDKAEIRLYDDQFIQVESYELGQSFEKEGGYQGIVFINDDLYVNLHGSNNYCGDYAYGLDHYQFENNRFTFIERIKPPTYGAGQGIDYYDGKTFWVDRPSNQIVITSDFNIWK